MLLETILAFVQIHKHSYYLQQAIYMQRLDRLDH